MSMKRIVSVSGGKDSTALYLLAIERGKPFDAVFADTGHEAQQTYDYIRDLPSRAGGPPIRTVRADFRARLAKRRASLPQRWREHGITEERIATALDLMHETGIPFLDAILYRGMFPSRVRRYCTKDLKIQPIEEQVYKPLLDRGEHVVSWQGVRARESKARSVLAGRQKANMEFVRDKTIHIFRPLLRWTVDDVFALIARHGLKVNPLYSAGFMRVGCFPCIYATKQQISLLADKYPEAIDKLEEWERLLADVGRIAHARSSGGFFSPKLDPMWQEGDKAGIRQIVDWAQTARGGRQLELLEARSKEQRHFGESCLESGACE